MPIPLTHILSQFATEGRPGPPEPYGAGHIHDTYRAENREPGCPGYVLQRINHRIFGQIPELMENIGRVTDHLRQKLQALPGGRPDRETVTVVPARDGQLFYRDAEGNYWRVYRFIAGARSYDIVGTPDQAYQGGKAFGRFGALLSDLPAARLHETLPDFHDIEKRLDTFERVLAADQAGRAAGVGPEVAFVRERAQEMGTILRWGRAGKLPLRITHNDTKFNNVLLDERDQALCVVDLDTVMPGYVAYDFGDSIRTTANTAAEDEADLPKIDFNADLFEAYTRGYLEEMGPFLTPDELESLPLGCKLMPYIMGVRFLTDYLDGDGYYKIHFPEQNLRRARAQFAYLRRLEARYADLGRIIRACAGRAPKRLPAPYLPFGSDLEELSAALDAIGNHPVAEVCWPDFPYRPDVSVAVAHSNEWLLLKYDVQEEAVQARYTNTNEPVYEDSCVECFLSLDGKGYYNFEFNARGVCLAAFGPSREERQFLDPGVIARIRRLPSLSGALPQGQARWQLTVAIPVAVFTHHRIKSLAGMEVRANFYKCGDKLPRPHFLTWNRVDTPEPDFHRPEFFGLLQLG